MNGFRVRAAVVFFVVGLAVVLGLQTAAFRHRVDSPLRAAIASTPGVASYELALSGDSPELRVRLKPSADLGATWSRLSDVLEERNESRVTIVPLSNSTGRLDRAWEQLQFCVEEGASIGNFSVMHDRWVSGASRLRTAGNLTVGPRAVFATLTDGQHRLYRTVPRLDTARAESAPAAAR